MTLKFAKKLPTFGIHHKAIPDPEPTLPKGLLPDLPDPTQGIDTSLVANKIDEVKYLIQKHNFKILGLTETLLSSNLNSTPFEVADYALVIRERENRCGGVVLCYVHMSYEYDILTELDKYLDESITVLIKPKFQKLLVLSIIYRPPNSPVWWRENFLSYVEQCYQMSDEVLILRDFR